MVDGFKRLEARGSFEKEEQAAGRGNRRKERETEFRSNFVFLANFSIPRDVRIYEGRQNRMKKKIFSINGF